MYSAMQSSSSSVSICEATAVVSHIQPGKRRLSAALFAVYPLLQRVCTWWALQQQTNIGTEDNHTLRCCRHSTIPDSRP